MKKTILFSALLGTFVLASCAKEEPVADEASAEVAEAAEMPSMDDVTPQDGELAMPGDYSSWPVFMSGIEKSSGHIRDIYISEEGAEASKGDDFAYGTRFVMEIYNANTDADGKMTKADLAKVFVMAKGEGYGAEAATNNGEWVYAAFSGAGQPLEVDYESCRACHAPLADKDYIFHYDKYFDMRASAASPSYAEMLQSHAGLVAMNSDDVNKASAVLR